MAFDKRQGHPRVFTASQSVAIVSTNRAISCRSRMRPNAKHILPAVKGSLSALQSSLEIPTIRPPDVESANSYKNSRSYQSPEEVVSTISPIDCCAVALLPGHEDQENHKEGKNENSEVHFHVCSVLSRSLFRFRGWPTLCGFCKGWATPVFAPDLLFPTQQNQFRSTRAHPLRRMKSCSKGRLSPLGCA